MSPKEPPLSNVQKMHIARSTKPVAAPEQSSGGQVL